MLHVLQLLRIRPSELRAETLTFQRFNLVFRWSVENLASLGGAHPPGDRTRPVLRALRRHSPAFLGERDGTLYAGDELVGIARLCSTMERFRRPEVRTHQPSSLRS